MIKSGHSRLASMVGPPMRTTEAGWCSVDHHSTEYLMIGTLMTHMKELVNMRALQEIEEATHKAIETLPSQFAEMFYQELAKRLKGRGK